MAVDADVAIVGGGVAGLSAAVRLAREGARVAVFEGRSRLGGRATSIPDKETGQLVDNGQHVLVGAYVETFAFLREIGAIDGVTFQPQLSVSMIDRAGHSSGLTCPPFPPPFNLVAGLMEWDALGWRDKIAALQMSGPLGIADRQRRGRTSKLAASPGETVESWLVRHGQTPRLREMLWEPLALAVLNQSARQAAAPVFARVLAEMFGSDVRASAIVLPTVPLLTLFAEPARQYIEARGGSVLTGSPATIQVEGGAVRAVATMHGKTTVRRVVSAVPWFALPTLFDGDTRPLAAIVEGAGAMAASTIVTGNLWFDRPIVNGPFVGLPGRSMQWVFEHPPASVSGAGSYHLSMVASGAAALVEQTNEEILELACRELYEAIPEARSAALLRTSVVREPRATFSLAPGQPARPGARTPVEGLFLAGDWIDTGLPATIEGAVRSGHGAAELALGN